MTASSPAATGPAGSLFEGQIGAYYLLSMLTGNEPRGLPGTLIDKVAFQRGDEGHPLDDVIVYAHDLLGKEATLEIQVKRTITFTPSDTVFRKVVGQIVKTATNQNFQSTRYELAIATAKTSTKIETAYQEVLTWARQLGDAKTFVDRINRKGSANDDMRTFLSTFKKNLRESGSYDDNETVWRLLRRLQILVFDFTSQGSINEELIKERAAHALHPNDAAHAATFWKVLTEITLEVAGSGGDRTYNELLNDLQKQPFRLQGKRSHSSVLSSISESARHSLSDIKDKVGNVMLVRHTRIAAVREALDHSRYIEIRGDAGVGKSGILKHFAEQLAIETRIIVLTPDRTIPNGWQSMRSILGFDGTARNLLIELAGNGGGFLFIDNLDFFDEERQKTVIDLLRSIVDIPGFKVIATARLGFDADEPSWIPNDIISLLGKAPSLTINELNEEEINQLKSSNPSLSNLLHDNHPAKPMARNLFRLSRLLNQLKDEPIQRTEADMALYWWNSADGRKDSHHRERSRLLKYLATQSLTEKYSFDVSNYSTSSIDAFIKNETLRDLGNDKVSFHHDVLREWAIANILHIEPDRIDDLPSKRLASPTLSRGLELMSNLLLQQDRLPEWKNLLEKFNHGDIHNSWQRAVLLSIIRSEANSELLERIKILLLDSDAKLLCQLLRYIIATDVRPAEDIIRFFEKELKVNIPLPDLNGLTVATGRSWYPVINFILKNQDSISIASIPTIIDFYSKWLNSFLAYDSLSPSIVNQIYTWLIDIEGKKYEANNLKKTSLLNKKFDNGQLKDIEFSLRTLFIGFSHCQPKLIKKYLRAIIKYRNNDYLVRDILNNKGMLAQAAPKELAILTAKSLINKEVLVKKYRQYETQEPFGFVNAFFHPASPAQGPFLDLLIHAPKYGLMLIYALVEHARKLHNHNDSITLIMPERHLDVFDSATYEWSRKSQYNCLTSALMALEAWGHKRIDAGEDFESVIKDIISVKTVSFAYIAVTIDLIISHWPKSSAVGVPFFASPELLILDMVRLVAEDDYVSSLWGLDNLFGLKDYKKEPNGLINLASLKSRSSRKKSLKDLIDRYAESNFNISREKLTLLLKKEMERLGSFDDDADLFNPALMASHAYNLINPDNWKESIMQLKNNSTAIVNTYMPPFEEAAHFSKLQTDAQQQQLETSINLNIPLFVMGKIQASTNDLATLLSFSDNLHCTINDKDNWRILTSIALVVMRDGSDELKKERSEWAKNIFVGSLNIENDHIDVDAMDISIALNIKAIAFMGMAYSLANCFDPELLKALLYCTFDPASGLGFNKIINDLDRVNKKIPKAILRQAFRNEIKYRSKIDENYQEKLKLNQSLIEEELDWIISDAIEPAWPIFPKIIPNREKISRTHGQLDEQKIHETYYINHEYAALWLKGLYGISNINGASWLADIIKIYSDWTTQENGKGMSSIDDVKISSWNSVYYKAAAISIIGLSQEECGKLINDIFNELPEKSFFDTVTTFLSAIDDLYFIKKSIKNHSFSYVRSVLSKYFMDKPEWKKIRASRTTSIEWRVESAIGVLFFNDCGLGKHKCYLDSSHIQEIEPVISILQILIQDCPSGTIAIFLLDLLEVSPTYKHLPLFLVAIEAWLNQYSDYMSFWIDYGIGRRVCRWIDSVNREFPFVLRTDDELRLKVEHLLSILISFGLADAKNLEKSLQELKND